MDPLYPIKQLTEPGSAPAETAVGHDSPAIGAGGRVTLEYAISLARSGVTRDYVARALLARKVDPEQVKVLVTRSFELADSRARKRARTLIVAGIVTVVCGVAMQFAVSAESNGTYWSPLGVSAVLVGLGTAGVGFRGMRTRQRV